MSRPRPAPASEISGPVEKIRVLVIEDNRLVAERLAALLDAQPDVKVVAVTREPAAARDVVPMTQREREVV